MKKNKKVRLNSPVEKVFPHLRARQHADEVIDAMDCHQDMRAFVDAWEAAYFEIAGVSPFRNGVE